MRKLMILVCFMGLFVAVPALACDYMTTQTADNTQIADCCKALQAANTKLAASPGCSKTNTDFTAAKEKCPHYQAMLASNKSQCKKRATLKASNDKMKPCCNDFKTAMMAHKGDPENAALKAKFTTAKTACQKNCKWNDADMAAMMKASDGKMSACCKNYKSALAAYKTNSGCDKTKAGYLASKAECQKKCKWADKDEAAMKASNDKKGSCCETFKSALAAYKTYSGCNKPMAKPRHNKGENWLERNE